MTENVNIWDRLSLQWRKSGPPLRPAAQDIDLFQRLVADKCAAVGRTSPHAVLLGVTPEIATMRWPAKTRLLAIDCNMPMIRNVWPGNQLARAEAVCADWRMMPIADESCDVVVGDGCFVTLGYPEYDAVNRQLRRVLRPTGAVVLRFFIRPDTPETVAAVFNDLRAGRIGNFHVFKWRLAAALQRDLKAGVRIADVGNAWTKAFPDPDAIARQLGWSTEIIHSMDSWHESSNRCTFPTLNELRDAFSPYFLEKACHHPNYELGDRCPILLMEPR